MNTGKPDKKKITTDITLASVWLPEDQAIGCASESERYWLTDKNSLTSRLERFYNAKPTVKILQQELDEPEATELCALGISATKQQFIVRRVQLIVNDIPLVYARSILPANIPDIQQHLSFSAQTPIGKWLFFQSEVNRSAFEITRIHSTQLAKDSGAPTNQKLWGRRSAFSIRNNKILVTEYFLPALLKPDKHY